MVKELTFMALGAGGACLTIAGVMIFHGRKQAQADGVQAESGVDLASFGLESVSGPFELSAANDREPRLKLDWRKAPISPDFSRGRG